MAIYNVHAAKTNFSRLLDMVLEGEQVLITRDGVPVAELVPAKKKKGLILGSGKDDPAINWEHIDNEDYWRPMTEE